MCRIIPSSSSIWLNLKVLIKVVTKCKAKGSQGFKIPKITKNVSTCPRAANWHTSRKLRVIFKMPIFWNSRNQIWTLFWQIKTEIPVFVQFLAGNQLYELSCHRYRWWGWWCPKKALPFTPITNESQSTLGQIWAAGGHDVMWHPMMPNDITWCHVTSHDVLGHHIPCQTRIR